MMTSIQVSDRWYYFKVYTSCFIGSEAVQWLANELNISLSEAILVGNKMLNLNFFYHVVREHFFCNAYYFYRFNKVIRTASAVSTGKKRLSKSPSSSRASISVNGQEGGGGRSNEQSYCVCDLYPRQSELLSASSLNLSQLVEEIQTIYSFPQSSQSLEEEEAGGGEGDQPLESSEVKEHQHQSEEGEEGSELLPRNRLEGEAEGEGEGEESDNDWKVGSIESQEGRYADPRGAQHDNSSSRI
jgi:hypothetical protein